MRNEIYLDNAATSWPKPPRMIIAMQKFNALNGANAGRSGHMRSIESAKITYETRQRLAMLFGLDDPLRIVFSKNITEAINLVLLGILNAGDHVVTSSMEHNSVMRPLRYLASSGIEVSTVRCSAEGKADPEDFRALIQPNTKLICLLHASNVVGTIMPVREVGKIAREHGLLFLVDTAQTAGTIPLAMQTDYIDFLAFTGHKSLYGPMGTGGVAIGERVDLSMLKPLMMGGTGSHSEFEEQPDFLPDKYESGTQNIIGLAGLNTSLVWLENVGIQEIANHKKNLCQKMIDGLMQIEGIRIYGPKDSNLQTAVVSFIIEGMDNGIVSQTLDEKYGILCRVGLHCAPSAIKTIQAFPQGTIRFSIGYFNTEAEIDTALQVIQEISTKR